MKRFFIVCICLIILLSGTHYATANDILVYDPGSGDIQQALFKMHNDPLNASISWLMNFNPDDDVRNAGKPLKNDDLQRYSVLVVGWSGSDGGNYSGLTSGYIETGITGNILLTGHDPDFHFVNGDANDNTKLAIDKTQIIGDFLRRAIEFGKRNSGTGLVVLADWLDVDPNPPYDALPLNYWLPTSYGIVATETADINSNNVTITSNGMASGIYNIDSGESDMSGWLNSYHAGFLSWDSSFNAFEMGQTFVLGDDTYTPAVTIARTVPEPTTLLLLGLSLIGLAVTRKKF